MTKKKIIIEDDNIIIKIMDYVLKEGYETFISKMVMTL
jgi:hypothetical protein